MEILTVCVITYNHGLYIAQCLDSILEQKTDFDFRIAIGEDSSSDNTADICRDYQKRYADKIDLEFRDRKNVIKINGKPTGRYNFQETLKMGSRSKYIALCEGDDYWKDPYKLQKQVNLMEQYENASLCAALTTIYDQSNNTYREIKPFSGNDFPLLYLDEINSYFHTSAFVIRNRHLKEVLNEHYQLLQGDTSLRYLLISKGPFVVLNDYVSVYRVSGKGIWTSISDHDKDLWHYKAFEGLRKNFLREQRPIHLKNELKSLNNIITYHKRNGSRGEFLHFKFKYLILMLQYKPFQLLPYRIKKYFK